MAGAADIAYHRDKLPCAVMCCAARWAVQPALFCCGCVLQMPSCPWISRDAMLDWANSNTAYINTASCGPGQRKSKLLDGIQ